MSSTTVSSILSAARSAVTSQTDPETTPDGWWESADKSWNALSEEIKSPHPERSISSSNVTKSTPSPAMLPTAALDTKPGAKEQQPLPKVSKKPPPPSVAPSWTCHRCTLINEASSAICSACDASKVESIARSRSSDNLSAAATAAAAPARVDRPKSPANPFDDPFLAAKPGNPFLSPSIPARPKSPQSAPSSAPSSSRQEAAPERPTVTIITSAATDSFDPFSDLMSPTQSKPLSPLAPLPSVVSFAPAAASITLPPSQVESSKLPTVSSTIDSNKKPLSSPSDPAVPVKPISAPSSNPSTSSESPISIRISSPAVSSADESPSTRLTSVTNEIMQSEQIYRDYLLACITFYHEPVKKQRDRLGVTDPMILTIFSNLPVLAQFHSLLLKDLMSNSPEQTLLRYVDFFRLYVEYVSNFSFSCATLSNLMSTNKSFKAFLAAQLDKYPQRQDLNSLLIMPVQRLPRYVLLLRELRRYAPSDRHALIDSAIDKVEAICQRINQAQSEAERLHSISQLQRKLKWPSDPNIPTLLAPSRKLLREDDVRLVEDQYSSTASLSSPTTPARIHLFNDAILITSSSSSSASIICWAPLSSVRMQSAVEAPSPSETLWSFHVQPTWISSDHSPLYHVVSSSMLRADWDRFRSAAVAASSSQLSPPRL